MFVLLAILLVSLLLLYKKWSKNYWKRKGVEQLDSTDFLFGNIKELLWRKVNPWEFIRGFYEEFKHKGLKFGGIYTISDKIFLIVDAQLAKTILIKDFDSFVNRGLYYNEELEPLTANLFSLEGPKWRALRQKLTPTFTSGKMKMMYQTMVNCASGINDVLNEYEISGQPVEIRDVLARFTTDVIGNCAFGFDCNSLKDPNSEFRVYGRKLMEPTVMLQIKAIIIEALPKSLVTALGIKTLDREVEKFFFKVVKENVEYREKNNVIRKDFLQLLLQLKNQGQVDDTLTVKKTDQSALSLVELVAQCFVFFVAGFGTSSDVMTFALYELALNQDVQDKLRQSIIKGLEKYDNEMSYDAIQEITDLENVINETMRKYPVLPMLPRGCTKDYPIVGTDMVIQKGTMVWIAITGFHYDPAFFPNPDKFNPDRFYEDNPDHRSDVIFLPFGDGPRQCIGLRFGMLQSKVGLATIIKNYKITLDEKSDFNKKQVYIYISKA